MPDSGNKPGFDPVAVRAEFPILSRTVHGRPLVYLDNAASAQKPRAVIEKIKWHMEHSYANVHRGLHQMANDLDGTRNALPRSPRPKPPATR